MLEEHNKREKIHLVNLIGRRSNETPNFALLIGAGASASSGVRTSSQMIAEWHRQLHEQSKSDEPLKEWLRRQDWYEDEEEYSILFERVCDQRSQRRIYIEECVKDARPSWGYIYLANIIAYNYFNVIFTPNFDDLLNEACFLYADLRPVVCAHDSAVADLRVTSARPKIIKLHGDFLYDSIKNTVRETETLEKNTRDKFMQFAREYGLVVVGYGGNDRSIMDILDTMLKSEGYFPNGLYWCKRKGNKVSRKLERLMRPENAYWVEIQGFDELMAELHQGLSLTLPDAVRDPYKATTERLNTFISAREEVKHEIIKSDIRQLGEQVTKFQRVVSGEAPEEELDRIVPYRFLGDREAVRKNYKRALVYYEKALIENPHDLRIMELMVVSYNSIEQFDEALGMSERMIGQAPTHYRGHWQKGMSLDYLGRPKEAIASYSTALQYTAEKSEDRAGLFANRADSHLRAGNWEEALSDAEKALQIDPEDHVGTINKCIALKKLGRKEEADRILRDTLPRIDHEYYRAGAFAVLGERAEMLRELEAAIEENSANRVKAKSDPDFADYREDPDFRKLVYEGDE